MSKKCAICGEKIGFSEGKFISEKYVCKACYELNEKKKLSEPHKDNKDGGYSMGEGLIHMADAFENDSVFSSSINKK